MEKSVKVGTKRVDVWVIPVEQISTEDKITVRIEEDDVHIMQNKWDEEDLAMQRGEQEYLDR